MAIELLTLVLKLMLKYLSPLKQINKAIYSNMTCIFKLAF